MVCGSHNKWCGRREIEVEVVGGGGDLVVVKKRGSSIWFFNLF